MGTLIALLIGSFALLIPILCLLNLIWVTSLGKNFMSDLKTYALEIWVVVIVPSIFLFNQEANDCCTDSSAFSPDHILSVWILYILCMVVFLCSRKRKVIAPPLTELLINLVLLIGVIFNFFLIYQEAAYGLLGTIPIILLFLTRLVESHNLLQQKINSNAEYQDVWESNAYYVLTLKTIQKYPMLLLLCVPLLVIFICVVLLFGQEPDSMIRAFTDTYKHGFSQWDYKCDNVDCGGHYLCSVAAQGHSQVVKPIRYGHRNGGLIICNRQLLISNAFEEMIMQRFPKSHKVIRKNYDIIGNQVKRHYHLFSIKWISDLVYIFMKPLEWMFLISLYLFEHNPESKIAQQYTRRS